MTRTHRVWWLRGIVALGLILFFTLPYRLTAWIPLWLPFLAALAVELHFFVSGLRGDHPRRAADASPQQVDLDDLGRAEWVAVRLLHGGRLWIAAGELTEAEVGEWLQLNGERLAALPPGGQFETGPLQLDAEDEIRPLAAAASVRSRRLPVGFLVSVAILAAVAVVLSLRPSGWQRLSAERQEAEQAQFSRLAAGIAGHTVSVRCDTSGTRVGAVQEADGLAVVSGRQMWLTPEICFNLVRLEDGDLRPDSDAAGHAVVVLAHEAWHLHGVSDEGLANCFAYQSGARIAEQLGVSAGTAHSMMKAQLADNPIEFAGSPAYLIPAGCRNDGRYDLHPRLQQFP